MNRRYLALAALLAVVVVVLSAVALIAATRPASPNSSGLSTFTSYGDMERYLGGAPPSGGYRFGGADAGAGPGTASTQVGGGYSGTNVQVAGVDEMDLVKTDGTYVYVASWSNVSVIRAVPPTAMAVVSRIPAADLGIDRAENESVWIAGLYVDGPRLYIVSVVYTISREPSPGDPAVMDVWWYPTTVRTAVSLVDLSQVDRPVRTRVVAVSGYPLASRMVDGTVYLVAQEWIYYVDEAYVVPELCDGGACASVPATSIWYDPGVRDAGSFTNILAVDGRTGGHGLLSIVTSYSSTLYMSPGALYLTFFKWRDDSGSWWWVGPVTYWTSIYKVRVDRTALEVVAQGDVGGSLWSQFALDERDGYLRVVTQADRGSGANVYVLDSDLARVGALEGLAPGEQVFATRFVGSTLYLVTFRRVDPFFVIDLSNPAKPAVLGELTIPGFSTYLHPVDADHVLGVGSENGTVKVSLYDVSDPMAPVESSKLLVDGYSWSIAQYEHKAFLFDRAKELLVIPVDRWDEGYRTTESGAYVFRASVDAGITLRGVVSHGNGSSYYGGVQRSLFIGDVLYTVSYTTLKASALSDLSELGSLDFETFP